MVELKQRVRLQFVQVQSIKNYKTQNAFVAFYALGCSTYLHSTKRLILQSVHISATWFDYNAEDFQIRCVFVFKSI